MFWWLFNNEDTLWCLSQGIWISVVFNPGHILHGWTQSDASGLYDEGTGRTSDLSLWGSQKKHLKVDKLWSAIEEQIHKKLEDYLENSCLKYLLHLVKVDDTSAYLIYKNFERKQTVNEDDLRLGRYEYEWTKIINTVCVKLIAFQNKIHYGKWCTVIVLFKYPEKFS